MHGAIDTVSSQARAVVVFQLHKSLGLSILLLSVIRLLWRWRNPPPALPSSMARWEAVAAKITHWTFYALMIGLPLSGWLYVSTQWRAEAPLNIPTLWFGLFEVPHLFGLNELSNELRAAYASLALETHEILAWGMAGLLALHVAAALKHQLINHDDVLTQMAPLLKSQTAGTGNWQRKVILTIGLVSILCALAALTWAAIQGPSPRPSASTSLSGGSSTETSNWQVKPESSSVRFSGMHAGLTFNGHFRRWQADINFDSNTPEQSEIQGHFEITSITDGVPLHDETLLQEEWFDEENHPFAVYRSTRISQAGDGIFELEGLLEIKEAALKIPPLRLTLENNQMHIIGSIDIDRSQANLGMESDPDAEYVSRNIRVDIHIEAVPTPL